MLSSAGEFSLSVLVLFQGAVDCSAAADVGDGFFAGATDEENELRVYDVKGGPELNKPDVGLEAAVKVGPCAWSGKKSKNATSKAPRKLVPDLLDWFERTGQRCERKKGAISNLAAPGRTRS